MSSKKPLTTKKTNNKKDARRPLQTALDRFKWLVIIALIIVAVVANIYYGQVAGALRAAIGIVGFLVLLWLFFTTAAGQVSLSFFKGAQTEMRKVVWPTRPEALQMTVIVLIILVVMSIILWGVDSCFLWLVGLLTGQGG